MNHNNCPFCAMAEDGFLRTNNLSAAFRDAYPLSEGHTLVVPRRHVGSILELSPEEYTSVWELTAQMCKEVRTEFDADGLNVGINDGTAAGQTVSHLHIHIIPRHTGDVPDPRGGIRWIIPEKAAYWRD